MDSISLIDEYLAYLRKMTSFTEPTLKVHQRWCKEWKTFLDEKFGKALIEAEPENLLQWITYRQEEGAVKDVTVRKELCVFRSFYGYLRSFHLIRQNPTKSLPELICLPADEQIFLTAEECFNFLESFDRDTAIGLRNYTITALLWSTGLRSSELCSLDWRDIDLKEATLLVRKGKGNKQRQLFLNDRILEDLRIYHAQFGGDGKTPVFCSAGTNKNSRGTKNGRLSKSGLVQMVGIQANRIKSPKLINPKVFRHTFATHMFEAGVCIEDIKEMLGHNQETETCIYVHVTLAAAKNLLADHSANPWKYQ